MNPLHRTRIISVVAAVMVVIAGTLSVATPANAADTSWYRLKNLEYGQCIQAGELNEVLRLAPCRSIQAQRWSRNLIGGRYFLVNQRTGYSMEVNQGTSLPGELVDTWFGNGTLAETWSEIPRSIGGVSYENAGSHLCLDTVGGAGSQLMQWYCDPFNRAQAWLLLTG